MLKSGTLTGGMAVRLAHSPNSRAECPHGGAGLGYPSEQVHRALVETEVVDCAHHGAILDEVHPVAGQAGQQQGGRIDFSDVPEAGEQQAPFGGAHQVLH